MSSLRAPLRAAVATLFPPACPLCRSETGTAAGLCPECWRHMSFLGPDGCPSCGRALVGTALPGERCDECLAHPPLWDRGAACFRYAGAGRRLVLGLKHGDRQDLVPMLGTWALRAGRPLIEEADLIAPIPLHWTRRLKRRGNQSAELARWLARTSQARFAPRLLLRTRRTGSQDGKDRAARVANLAGALARGPGPDPRGRRVLLVDDVLTTGATLNAATAVLRQMGARSVDVLVLALVDRAQDAYIAPSNEEESHDES